MRILPIALMGLLVAVGSATAEPEPRTVVLTLKNHQFTPETIEVAAGQRIRIDLINQDGATEEFDSQDLRVEKYVTPYGEISFFVGPLSPGLYRFMGELHADTAHGTITVAGSGETAR